MTHLQQLLKIRWPADVAKIRSQLSGIYDLSDFEIQEFYHEYSESMWCASWLAPGEETIQEFKEWLQTEITETDT